jgi:hypothetical protein
MTIATTTNSASPTRRLPGVAIFWLALPGLALLGIGKGHTKRGKLKFPASLQGLLLLAFLLASCGGGGSNGGGDGGGGGGGGQGQGTQPATYTITVTGTLGALSHQAPTVTLVVIP